MLLRRSRLRATLFVVRVYTVTIRVPFMQLEMDGEPFLEKPYG